MIGGGDDSLRWGMPPPPDEQQTAGETGLWAARLRSMLKLSLVGGFRESDFKEVIRRPWLCQVPTGMFGKELVVLEEGNLGL